MSEPDSVINPDAFRAAAPITTPQALGGDGDFERSLRPRDLGEFVGQERVVDNLKVALQAARARDEAPDHILLSGPPGLGKTSLARILATELGSTLHATTGPALDRARDLIGILTQLKRGDVLFIDEIHRIPASVEEYLYTAMEDFSIDFTLDSGPNARILPLSLERFTLVGATTREGLLTAPLRGRFGITERLAPYPNSDLVLILERAARLLGLSLSPEAASRLAERSRGTPRVAGRFLRRARDLAEVEGTGVVDLAITEACLERLGVDQNGLELVDRAILAALARASEGLLGLRTIAASIGEAEDTIEEVFEPHLLRLGFLEKTSRGRRITDAGRAALRVD